MSTNTERNAFTRGYGIAVAELIRSHGEETLAYYLAQGAGYSYADFVRAGMEEYDLVELRKMYELHDDLPAQAGEAGTAETTEIGSVHEHAVPEGDAP